MIQELEQALAGRYRIQRVLGLDVVFWRDEAGTTSNRIVGVARVDVLGDADADRTVSGLWPSDHAGVVATLTVRLP